MHPEPATSIVRSTIRALLEPRRLLPILVVCAPLILIQSRYSNDPLAGPLGVAMCTAFVLIAPLSWRVLFPEGIDLRHGAIRLFLYGAIGAGVVLVLGEIVPIEFQMRPTLMTARGSLPVCCALFLVGGWGLGRDIGFEASLLRERRRADVLAQEAEHAQLLAIRSHLDPHFLFNTLNAIAEWCREDGEVAERAVLQLSGILRAVLAGVRAPAWPLGSELGLVRDLFALHLLRDPSLFTLDWSVASPVPDASVLPMILLPLAENAIKHGPAAGHRGVVHFRVVVGGDHLRVAIENPGPYAGPRAGSEGLPTVQRRLQLAYGGAASIRIEGRTGPDGAPRTRVELAIPSAGPRREVIV
jgi:two-component system sensor histidine kinase AlgZ